MILAEPANGEIGVALNSRVAVTFSEPIDPFTLDTTTFTLRQPGGAAIAGTLTLSGLSAVFSPAANLAANTVYTGTITTGVTDLAGNPLAADFNWTFTTGTAVDRTPPTVTFTDPASGEINVPINNAIAATFSKGVDPLSINSSTFIVTAGGAPVAGRLLVVGRIVTFTPSVNLATNTVHTVSVNTGVRDLSGNALAEDFTWSFTTGATTDSTPPTVTSTHPAQAETGVAVNRKITATFSEGMDPLTLTIATFTVAGPDGVALPGVVTFSGRTATFRPASALAINTTFSAIVTTGARDLAGNALAENFTWSFRTGVAADTTAPTLTSTDPANAATGVPTNKRITATFSEGMDPLTLTNRTFRLLGPGGVAVIGTVSYVGRTATFRPNAALPANTSFTARVTTGATDLAGNGLVATESWTFTTGAGPDATPPTVTLTDPLNGASDVPRNKLINATFSEGLDPLTINNRTFTVAGVPGTVSYDAVTRVATFRPTNSLAANTVHTATISTGVTDLRGNALASNFSWSFTTGIRTVPKPIDLGSAALFGSFGGGAGVTNQGIFTVVNGDLSTTGASTLITGFHDRGGNTFTETPLNRGFVNGTIYTATAPPGSNPGVVARQGALDARTAFNNMSPAALPGGIRLGTDQLGGLTLAPGIYQAEAGSYQITGADLTLDAQGDANAVWVFQMASSLTVGGPGAAFPRSVILRNGAQAKNVFWQVGSLAVINAGGGGTMVGTIIAEAGVNFSTAGNVTLTRLNGRALGLSASVTMVNTIVNVPGP